MNGRKIRGVLAFVALAWMIIACRRTARPESADPPVSSDAAMASEVPDASDPQPPVGSPGFCPGDDKTGVALAKGSMPSELPILDARRNLDDRNSICGDSWCEGSFEWYFYDVRTQGQRSELTLRTYSTLRVKNADVTSVLVSGPQFVGRVLSQHVVPSCTSPCQGFKSPPRWAPCLVLDLRCSLALSSTGDAERWERVLIDCGLALESAVRKRIPEFPPRH
jgi:hypothetical protein